MVKMSAFLDFNEINENRVAFTQATLLDLFKGLDVEIYRDQYDSVFGTPFFELSYVKLTKDGFGETRRLVFNVKKANVYKIENAKKIDARQIDQFLLERCGLNVLPVRFQDSIDYEPKILYRHIAIDYGALYAFQMSGILTECGMTTYHEMSWKRNDEESSLFDHIRLTDPEFQLVPQNHVEVTACYNRKLKKAMKGVILVESIRLSEDILGFYKNPFDFRGLHTMQRELGHISGVNSSNYLESNHWLEQINDSMSGWAYSCFQNQKWELENFQNWNKRSLEKMELKLKIHETRLWREIGEESSHVEHLQNALNCYKIYAEFNRRASEQLYGKVRDMAKDLALLHEKIIERYF